MARGKHKAGATTRRSIAQQATLDQLRSELEMEQAALSAAEETLEEVSRLQSDLKAEKATLLDDVLPYAEQLTQERDFLRSVFADASAHHSRISDAWNRYLSAAIDVSPGATQLEKIESMYRALGGNGWLNTADNLPGTTEQVTRIQRARGERRTASDHSGERARLEHLKLVLDIEPLMPPMILPSYRQRLIDEGIVLVTEDGRHRLRDSAELTDQQLNTLEDAVRVAEQIWESRANDLSASGIRVWGSGNLISAEGAPGPSRLALGLPTEAAEPADRSQLGVAPGLPLASTPATTRRALALSDPEALLGSWRGVFESRRLVAEQLGLPSHPFAPLAHHPQPSQGLAVQNAYALASFSRWLHLGAGSAYAEASVGLTSAATYWLPGGQTASFAESEPMDESDRAEMILPFPQVFLAFAEPLLIEPAAAPDVQALERWRVFSQIAHDVYRDALPASHVVTERSRLGRAEVLPAPTIDEMLSELGAHIEGVLLLGDALGRPDDLFAWCLAIPGAYGSALGRFVVPALRSTTEYRDVVDNLTAVVAWAQWHEPDQSTALPLGISTEDLEGYVSSRDFKRNAKRAGAGIRVVDVGATHRGSGSRAARDTDGAEAHVTPHIRRGHWRRQRYGQRLEQSKRIRIAPVLVNAHRGDIAPRVYKLRSRTQAPTPKAQD